MNDKASINLTGKDAAKLLEGLTKDPQLRLEDDPSILAEEQFPTDHHALASQVFTRKDNNTKLSFSSPDS